MKTKKQQYVTIKGTKNGLTLHLDDACSFDELLDGLQNMLSIEQYTDGKGQKISVHIKLGHRYLYQEQAEQLTDLIASKKDLVVHSIDSEVIAKEEAQRMKEEQEIVSVSKIVRSARCFT